MKLLKAYGIPEILDQELIAEMCAGTTAKVVTADRISITEAFDILARVLQGHTLVPYLFVIVIDYIMKLAIDDEDSEYGFTFWPARLVGGLVVRSLQI